MKLFLMILISALTFYLSLMNFLSIIPKLVITRMQKTIIFSLYFIGISIAAILGNAFTSIILLAICLFFIISKKKVLIHICLLFISYLFTVLCDYLVGVVLGLLGVDLSSLSQSHIFILIIYLFIMATTYILSKIISICIKKRLSNLIFNREILIIITINLLICLIIFIFNIVAGESIGYSNKTTYFNGILFFSYFTISSISIYILLKSYLRKIEIDKKQEAFDTLQEYTGQIEKMYSDLRSFKHDYANIMLSMSGYIKERDFDGLEKHFSENIFPISKQILHNEFQPNRLMNINCSEIKSLIYAKAIYAHEIGIEFNIEVTEPVTIQHVDLVDLSRILGIFLDNAIEASQEMERPTISMSMINNGNSLAIIIVNNYISNNFSIQDINKLSVSSKGKNRGVGLYNVSNIVSQYSNLLWDTQFHNGLFTQHLEITRPNIAV